MKVVNDKDEKIESPELDFINMLSYAALCAFGMATAVFSPLPMISAHQKLEMPWSRIACVVGALFAVLLLEIPLPIAIITFVFGLFVADFAQKNISITKLLFGGVLVGAGSGLGVLFLFSKLSQKTLEDFWFKFVENFIAQVGQLVTLPGATGVDALQEILLVEGPFLYLSFLVVSAWLSIGFASHLGWFPKGHSLSADRLREFRLPKWAIAGFLVLCAGLFRVPDEYFHYYNGAFRFVTTFFFVQGCVGISNLMQLKQLSARGRTAFYGVLMISSLLLLVGYYALVGIGLIFPLMENWRKKI